ncbi:CorA-like Mg2+ transporter protein, putative [Plasmodium relictum]|uniref:Magnesium transporter n=1 Tax=Plasmodium relictum TaxID=85471 RepID=A0A1J1HA72_PLARL|nr:CorA-like Mg2+ transporter protein, putative [Plasmodium relictum]CRH02290.1 CorA-like Mg2+ transporter protein, putative [Plasmodium relictum]
MSFESLTLMEDDKNKKKNYGYDDIDYNDEDMLNGDGYDKDIYAFNIKNKIVNHCKRIKVDLDSKSKKENSFNDSTFIKREKSFLHDENELRNRRSSISHKNESKTKLEGILNENDFLIQLNKLKRHVVVEIFGGKCFIREYLCTEFLRRIKQCCHINYVKYNIGLINYRDCKQLLGENNNIASIEVRLNSILVSLPPLTCVILHSSIFLVIKEDLIRDDLIKKLCAVSKKYTNLYKADINVLENRPFEFCALECVFSSALEHLNAEMKLLNKDFTEIKFSLKISKYQEILSNLHNLKDPTNLLVDKVNSFIKAFHEISVNNADLKKMELTKYYFNPNVSEEDNKEHTNQDLEMLLEYFDQELHQIHDQVKHLYESIINLENRIYLDLSLSRNNLIRMDIVISLINSGFGIGTLITGIFGMNLKIFLEKNDYAFGYVTGLVVLLCLLTIIMSIYFFKCIRL